MNSQAKRRSLWFLGFLALFSAGMNYVLLSRGFGQLTVLGIMWCPGAAAFAASLITGRSLRAIGWKPGRAKWLLVGWGIPMAYATSAYLLAWITGLGAVPNERYIANMGRTLHLASAPPWLVAIVAYMLVATVVAIVNLIAATGEEIGWRGYLVPELTDWLGFRAAWLLSGAIWAVWHWVGIIWSRYNGGTATPKWYQIACFTAMVVLISGPLAWVRMNSGSMWTAALFHATHNGIIQAFLDPVTRDTGHTSYFTGEFGILLVATGAAAAWWVSKRSAAGRFERG